MRSGRSPVELPIFCRHSPCRLELPAIWVIIGLGDVAKGCRELHVVILAHEPPFRIGPAEFRPATREAVCNGRSTMLEPRVMQLLVALHRAGGSVVSKDDLAQSCWDGRIVGEDAINRVVSRLRSAADKLGKPFRIETITKVGYRLFPADGSAAAPQRLNASASGVDRRLLLVGAGAAAATAAGIAGFTIFRDRGVPSEARLLVEDAREAFKTDDPNLLAECRRQASAGSETGTVKRFGLGPDGTGLHDPDDNGSAGFQAGIANSRGFGSAARAGDRSRSAGCAGGNDLHLAPVQELAEQ